MMSSRFSYALTYIAGFLFFCGDLNLLFHNNLFPNSGRRLLTKEPNRRSTSFVSRPRSLIHKKVISSPDSSRLHGDIQSHKLVPNIEHYCRLTAPYLGRYR